MVYSHGDESVAGLVSERDFTALARRSKSSQIFTLETAEARLQGKSVVVKEIQRGPVAGEVLHVDFQALREDEAISVAIPLVISGEAVGVKLNGGILTVLSHELEVSCLPRLIPDSLTIDVSALDIGDSLHASDVRLPEGVELDCNPEETLVSVVTVKVVEEKPAVAAEGAVLEGAAAEGAAAAAPAEGAAASAEAGKAKEGDKGKDKGK